MKEEKDDFESKSQNIRQLAALPPDELTNHLTNVHPNIDSIAPNLSPHVFSAATNAIQFLNSKLPSAGSELLQDPVVKPSKAQRTAWLDLHSLVNDPVSVLDRVKDHTINGHHLEAMQTIYPDLHDQMKTQLLEELSQHKQNGGTLSYQRRLAMSKFIGEPLDSTMTVQNMQAVIKSASVNTGPEAQASSQQGARATKPSGPQLTQINKVNAMYQTASQATQAAKRN